MVQNNVPNLVYANERDPCCAASHAPEAPTTSFTGSTAESHLPRPAIRIITDREVSDRESCLGLDLKAVCTIQHDVKALSFGNISRESISGLLVLFRDAWVTNEPKQSEFVALRLEYSMTSAQPKPRNLDSSDAPNCMISYQAYVVAF